RWVEIQRTESGWVWVRLEPLEQAVEVFEFFAGEGAVAGAAADFVEDVAGFLAVHFLGDFHGVAETAVAIVQAAEDVALVAFLLGFGIVLVVEAGEFAGAVLQGRHRLVLRFARGSEVAAAEGFLGALLHLDGVAEQAARAIRLLSVDAIA